MTNDQDTQAQDFLNKMPPSLPQSRTL
ncbi:MAG: hypothetical protein RL260_2798, partial [Pseudomonadota bacterium]